MRPLEHGRGTTMVEMLVGLVVMGVILLGILPVLDMAAMTDRGAENTTDAATVATQTLELLKLYRTIQLAGGTIPQELGDFTPTGTGQPYVVDGTGVWDVLQIDPSRFDVIYSITNDPNSGRLQARVSVRSQDPLANKRGGGEKWVEFVSGIE